MICKKIHRFGAKFSFLPKDQGGNGRHVCAGCAYDKGFNDGKALREKLDLDLSNLPESQAGAVRHRSPHAAYAQGYLDGVNEAYN